MFKGDDDKVKKKKKVLTLEQKNARILMEKMEYVEDLFTLS